MTKILFSLCVVVLIFLAPLSSSQASTLTNSYVIEGANGVLPAKLASMVTNSGGILVRTFPQIGSAQATSADSKFASKMQKQSGISRVTRDIQLQWIPTKNSLNFKKVTAQGPLFPDPAGAFFFACQWNLQQIDAPGAWAQNQFGDASVEIADLDTGVDPDHLDLDGHIDLVNSASVLTTGSSPCGAPDETTTFDFNAHGTFVASLMTGNGFGMAAVAPLTPVVAVKVLNCSGSGSFGDVIAGILYASSLSDVKIINMSLSAAFFKNEPGAGPLIGAVNKAVNYATGAGKLVVTSAGNNGLNTAKDGNIVVIPAQSGTATPIYATDNNDHVASYSNFGIPGSFLGGPGGDFPNGNAGLPGCVLPDDLESLVLGACSIAFCGDEISYLIGDGTSFASPMAASIAALVDAENGGNLSPGTLRAILAATADDLGKKGTDTIYSHGRVNASNAVQ